MHSPWLITVECIRGLLCRNCNRMIGHAEEAGADGEGVELVQYEDLTGVSSGLWRA